jgi:S1-C subfamily serine protease
MDISFELWEIMASVSKGAYDKQTVSEAASPVADKLTPKDDSVWAKVSREMNVLGGGLFDGAYDRAVGTIKAPHELLEQSATIATYAYIFGAIKTPLVRGPLTAIALVGNVEMLKQIETDATKSLSAIVDTWRSPQNLESDRAAIAASLTPLAVDTASLFLGALAGTKIRKMAYVSSSPLKIELGSAPNLSSPTKLSYDQLKAYEKALPSMFRVTGVCQGAGFAADESGLVVTARHNVSAAPFMNVAENVTVHNVKGEMFSARVVGENNLSDLALLKVDAANSQQFEPLSLAAKPPVFHSSQLGLGFPVPGQNRLFAAPGKYERTQVATESMVNEHTGAMLVGSKRHVVQMGGMPGFSGGPIVNKLGKAIGVVTNGATNDRNSYAYGLAATAEDVQALINSYKSRIAPTNRLLT